MSSLTAAIIASAISTWAPPPRLTVSEWADAERRLSGQSSSAPGRYHTSRTEYARGIMDAFSDGDVKSVVVMSSAQVAKTTILENVVGYFIHHDPGPMLVMFPDQKMADEFSKDRLTPMIRDTPALRDLVATSMSKKNGNTTMHKSFPGGQMTIGWASSVSALAGRPARIGLGDEVDRWNVSAGREGDPVRLFKKRLTAFWNSKEGYFSTPTIEGASRIETLYDESDRRLYWTPCYKCEEPFVLQFEHLKWEEGAPFIAKDGRTVRRARYAWFECPSCKTRIDDVQRKRMVARGRWVAREEFHGAAGFWLWEGVSPFSSPLRIADQWLGALGNIEEEKSVVNTVLGRTWRESGEAPDEEKLLSRYENYPLGTAPEGVLFLTLGADVQHDRIEVQVVGWGRGYQSWVVDYAVLPGDTSQVESDPWNRLTAMLSSTYSHDSKAQLSIMMAAVDSGYNAAVVYDWARRHSPSRVMVVKGFAHGNLLGVPTSAQVTSRGKRFKRGAQLWPANVSMCKAELYGWLRQPRPAEGEAFPSGWCHYPQMGIDWFRQLVAEQCVRRVDPRTKVARMEWVKIRERNEVLDTRNLNRIAAERIGISRFGDRQWKDLERQLATAPQADSRAEEVPAPVLTQNVAPAPPAPRKIFARFKF